MAELLPPEERKPFELEYVDDHWVVCYQGYRGWLLQIDLKRLDHGRLPFAPEYLRPRQDEFVLELWLAPEPASKPKEYNTVDLKKLHLLRRKTLDHHRYLREGLGL